MASKKASILVRILGDADNLKKATRGATSALGDLAKIGAAATAALGAGAIKLGTDFQQAQNNIRIATGASGEDLAGLNEQFMDVFRTVPAGMEEVSGAVGAIATQLALTGDDLENVTRTAVEFAEVMNADVAATSDNAARIMNQFGVSADTADDFFGDLLKTTQDYGISSENLLSGLESMGPALQSVGLSAEGAAAFLGEANRAGVEITRLKTPLLQFADAAIQAGQDQAQAVQDFAEQAAGLTSQTELLAFANETFGTTAGGAIAELIDSGVDLSSLNDVIGDQAGLVGETAEATRVWTDRLKILRDRALVKIEPVLSAAVDMIDERVIPALEMFGGFLSDHMPAAVDAFQRHVMPVIEDVGETVGAVFAQVTRWTRDNWDQIQATITAALQTVSQVVRTVVAAVLGAWRLFGDDLVRFVMSAASGIISVISGVVDVLRGVINFITGVFTGDWGQAWQGIKQVFSGVWEAFGGIVETAFGAVRGAVAVVIQAVKQLWDWSFLSAAVSTAVDKVRSGLASLLTSVRTVASDVVSAARSIGANIINGIGDGLTSVSGFAGDLANGLARAIKSVLNTQVIDRLNAGIPDSLGVGPFSIDLPNNPIPRFHSGGMVGTLGGVAREVPAVLQTGEFVLSRDDVDQILRGGGSNQTTINVTNPMPTPSDVDAALQLARAYSPY